MIESERSLEMYFFNFFEKNFIMKENVLLEPLTVNVKTAAKMLGVCERTIKNLTKKGELPVVRILGRVLYSQEDLVEFVRQRSKRNTSGENEATVSIPC
jgi:excisionase family DNA binding protein